MLEIFHKYVVMDSIPLYNPTKFQFKKRGGGRVSNGMVQQLLNCTHVCKILTSDKRKISK